LSEECKSLLQDISLQSNFINQWQWRYDHCDGYSVKRAYKLLTTKNLIMLHLSQFSFGINRSLSRFLFWLGDFSRTGFRLKIIWWRVTLFLMTLNYAWLVVKA